MYCGRCGKPNKNNSIYCEYCGAKLVKTNNRKNGVKYIVVVALVLIILVLIIAIISTKNRSKVYFTDDNQDRIASVDNKKKGNIKNNSNEKENSGNDDSNNSQSTDIQKTPRTKTAIKVDNYYYVDLKNRKEADDLIVKDSEDQKGDTADEIKAIERRMINNYKIRAVNLGEMDVDVAENIEKAFEYIYVNYPYARGTLSNMSICNTSVQEAGTIAYFGPQTFITSNTTLSGCPMSVKTLMCLTCRNFLNPEMFEASVKSAIASGHFPKNVTPYGSIVHESGHFLTFVATLKKYGLEYVDYIEEKDISKFEMVIRDWNNNEEPLSMAKEAYSNYKQKYNDNLSFDEFRASISGYAVAKDSKR